MRRATGRIAFHERLAVISIHALHEESDFVVLSSPESLQISIHALHEESDADSITESKTVVISIHALHEESDTWFPDCPPAQCYFNPRSP